MGKNIDLRQGLKLLAPVLLLIAAIETLIWVHWNSLVFTAGFWQNLKYSHGYLVPLFAAALLWLRRDETEEIIPSVAKAGAVLLGVGLLLCVLPFVLPDDALAAVGTRLSTTLLEAIGVALSVAGAMLIVQPRISFAQVPTADRWIGFAVLIGAELLRMWATKTYRNTPELAAFIPALAGVFVMVGGLKILKLAGWPIVFLVFMLPLPGYLDKHLSNNLQKVATKSSTYVLQTVGVQARYEGNDIWVGSAERPMTVAEACSGLRMLTIFGALSFAVALLIQRTAWQRVVIVCSSIPIALVVNILRITLTGILVMVLPEDATTLHKLNHDMWGLLMMPMAMGLLYLEIQVLGHLFIEEEDDLDIPAPLVASAPRKKVEPKPQTTSDPKPVVPPAGKAARPLPASPRPPRVASGNSAAANAGGRAPVGDAAAESH